MRALPQVFYELAQSMLSVAAKGNAAAEGLAFSDDEDTAHAQLLCVANATRQALSHVLGHFVASHPQTGSTQVLSNDPCIGHLPLLDGQDPHLLRHEPEGQLTDFEEATDEALEGTEQRGPQHNRLRAAIVHAPIGRPWGAAPVRPYDSNRRGWPGAPTDTEVQLDSRVAGGRSNESILLGKDFRSGRPQGGAFAQDLDPRNGAT